MNKFTSQGTVPTSRQHFGYQLKTLNIDNKSPFKRVFFPFGHNKLGAHKRLSMVYKPTGFPEKGP